MNSNRTKYASAPTYGMQKRNFAKKQAAAQPNPTPDFTQHSAMEANAPTVSIPAQNAFPSPSGAYSPMPSAPVNPMFFPNAPTAQPMGSSGFSQGFPAVGFQAAPPQGAPPSLHQPLGNRVTPAANAGASFHAQGFVPPFYNTASGFAGTQAPGGAGASPVFGAQATGAYAPMGAQATDAFIPMNAQATGAYAPMNTMPPMQPQANPYGGFSSSGMNVPNYGGGSFVPPTMNFSGGQGGFSGPPFSGGQGGGQYPAAPRRKPPLDPDRLLKILLYAALPALFIPCVFVTHTFDFLRYLFIILSVVSLSVLWYRQSFSSGIRTTVSVVYLALCIVVIAFLVGGTNDITQTSSNRQNAKAAAQNSTDALSPSVTPTELTAQETPPPEEDASASEAEARLTTFMDYWSANNFESMVGLVLPSWASKQDSAASSLFTVISNRTPQSYTIESISGTNGDSSRTVTMSAYIDKNNGKDPVRYRFMILMANEDNQWYVDPNSLATNETVDDTATPEPGQTTISQSLAPRMTVTPVPAADTKLYYNANNGKYYHTDPNCSAVNSKYLPLTSYFLYSQLDDAPYNALQPCLKCGAPTQSLSSLDSEATASPTPQP